MKENILILKDKKLAFEIDKKVEIIYSYHAYKAKPFQDSKAILKTINSSLAKTIENHFNVDIKSYGVKIDDSSPREEINEDKKKNIYTYKFEKIILTIAFIVNVVVMFNETDSPEHIKAANTFFSSVAMAVVAIAFIFIKGKEQFELDQLIRYKQYNITTSPLPNKDEIIASLEAKVEELKNNKKEL